MSDFGFLMQPRSQQSSDFSDAPAQYGFLMRPEAPGHHVHIENGAPPRFLNDEHCEPGAYEIPRLEQRRGLFWRMMAPLLGAKVFEPGSGWSWRKAPEPVVAADGSPAWVELVRRRDRRIRELNNATPVRVTLGDLAREAVEHVREAVKRTKTQRAIEWLNEMLKDGPVPQTTIETLARNENIGTRPLKTAKQRLKVQSVRKGRNHWAWRLPFFGKLPEKKRRGT
jgi:hypothetical protein